MEWQHRLSRGKNALLQRAERHEKRVLAVLFFIMLLIAVLTVGRRSFGYDTLGEQKILDSNIKAYAQTLAGEGSAWYQSFPEYIEDIRQSVEKDHGQAALYLFWPVKYLLRDQPQSTVNSAFYLCDHLIFLYALYALYRLVKGMTGQMAFGLAAVLLLYCNPRFFAESFINSKDVVLMSLCLIVFWHGWRFIKQDDWLSPILFGFFGALAFNLRLLGLGAFGVCGLAYLTDRTLKRAWSRRMVLRGALAVGTLALFYYLLTPASWANPVEFLQYVYENTVHFDSSRWNGLILYRGDWFNPKRRPIPWHYIPWWMIITTPLLILVLAFLCPAAIWWKSRADHAALLSSETVFCFWLGLFGLLPVVASMVGAFQPVQWMAAFIFCVCVGHCAGLCLAGVAVEPETALAQRGFGGSRCSESDLLRRIYRGELPQRICLFQCAGRAAPGGELRCGLLAVLLPGGAGTHYEAGPARYGGRYDPEKLCGPLLESGGGTNRRRGRGRKGLRLECTVPRRLYPSEHFVLEAGNDDVPRGRQCRRGDGVDCGHGELDPAV